MCSSDLDKFVSIWVLNNDEKIWSEDIGLTVIDVPYFGNIRLKNQFGKFTKLDSPVDTIEEFLENVDTKKYKITDPLLFKYNIPISEAKAALTDLSAMGIDYFKIFPDLTGICLEARKKIVLDIMT